MSYTFHHRQQTAAVTAPSQPSLLSVPFVGAVIAVGVFCGLGGAGFTLLLSVVEQLAFGFTTGTVVEAATQAPEARRFLVVVAAGLLASLAWWTLRRFGQNVPPISEAARGKDYPFGWTLAETALQVANVGAGASVGREGAPRQFGAMGAILFFHLLRLSQRQRLVLVACGAGAGLASIYNVPVGGTFFALESVLGLRLLGWRRSSGIVTILSALAASCLATAVAWLVVADRPIYAVPPWSAHPSIVVFALSCGPIFGLAGFGFGTTFEALAQRAPKGNAILWTMPLAYLALACLALPLPLVLGNGHALALKAFATDLPLQTALWLLLAKPIATFLTVGCGATGGKLTPSLATGAVLGMALAATWTAYLSPVPPGDAAIVGAGAMMAAAFGTPLTAFVLIIEFTASGIAAWPAVAAAVLGAWITTVFLGRLWKASQNVPNLDR